MCQPEWGRARQRRIEDLVRLRRVRDRIDREYAEPLNVEELARGAHMSAGHLSRQFKAAYGESPYSYLMTRRIERAMMLLRRGDMRVTDVCAAVGVASLGTFTTRFTELVGIPPGEFKRAAMNAMGDRQDDGQDDGQGDGQSAPLIPSLDGVPACLMKQAARPVRTRLN